MEASTFCLRVHAPPTRRLLIVAQCAAGVVYAQYLASIFAVHQVALHVLCEYAVPFLWKLCVLTLRAYVSTTTASVIGVPTAAVSADFFARFVSPVSNLDQSREYFYQALGINLNECSDVSKRIATNTNAPLLKEEASSISKDFLAQCLMVHVFSHFLVKCLMVDVVSQTRVAVLTRKNSAIALCSTTIQHPYCRESGISHIDHKIQRSCSHTDTGSRA